MSNFIVALIVVSLVMTIFALYFSAGANNYGVEWDNSTIESYQQLEALRTNITGDTEDKVTGIDQTASNDIIGGYISSAYQSLKISYKSIGIFNDMSDAAVDNAQLGDSAKAFKQSIILIVMILLLIGVIASALLKYAV